MEKRTESNSSLSTYRLCPRKYQLKYVDQIKKSGEQRSCISMGHNGHQRMEQVYHKQKGEPINKLDMCDDELMSAKLSALVSEYKEFYKDDKWTIHHIEYEFNVPFINPDTGASSTKATNVGKVDLIVEVGGKLWIVDHKFSGSIRPREYWRINSQMDMYISALRKQDMPVVGIIWNIIGTPSIRPKQVGKGAEKHVETVDEYSKRLQADIRENPDKYFQRHLIKRDDADIEESLRDMWMTNKDIMDCMSVGNFPRNCNSCYFFNTACEFMPLCSNPQLNPLDTGEFEKKAKRHEELEVF